MSVGAKIKKERQVKRMTQKELATSAGIAEISVRQYESEKRQPKIDQLQKIANALQINIIDILDDSTLLQNSNEILNSMLENMGESKSDTLNEYFEVLNEEGKDKAIEQVELLTKIPEYQAKTKKYTE